MTNWKVFNHTQDMGGQKQENTRAAICVNFDLMLGPKPRLLWKQGPRALGEQGRADSVLVAQGSRTAGAEKTCWKQE